MFSFIRNVPKLWCALAGIVASRAAAIDTTNAFLIPSPVSLLR
jgi:hypothetical protein